MKFKKNKLVFSLTICIVAGVLLFSFLLSTGKIKYGNMIQEYENGEIYSIMDYSSPNLDKGSVLKQSFVNGEDSLYSFSLKYDKNNFQKGLVFSIILHDENGKYIQKWVEDGTNISNDGYKEYVLNKKRENVQAKKYCVEIQSNQSNNVLVGTALNAVLGGELYVDGQLQTGDLVLKLSTEKYVMSTLIYSIVFCCLIAIIFFLLLYFEIWKCVILKVTRSFNHFNHNWKKYILDICMIGGIGLFGILLEMFLSKYNVLEYNTVGAFNEYRFLFIFTCVLIVYILFRLRKYLDSEPEKIFLFLFLAIGLLYVLAMPAEAEISWDEGIHYWNAVGLSHFLDGKANAAESYLYWRSGTGYHLPDSIENLRKLQGEVQNLYDAGKIVSAKTSILNNMRVFAYIPSAVGLWVGRGLSLPYALTFHLGVAMNMIVYVVVFYFAMKRLKSGKMIMATVAGITTAMFLASVYSCDSWIICFTALGMAYFIGAMQRDKKIRKKDEIIMLGSFSLAFMPKAIYFPLFLMYLLIPEVKFENRKQCLMFKITTSSLCITFALEMVLSFIWFIPILVSSWIVIWLSVNLLRQVNFKRRIIIISVIILAAGIAGCIIAFKVLPQLLGRGDLRGGEEVNSAQQVMFILNNPLMYIKILLHYIRTVYLSFQVELQVVFRTFGYIGSSSLHVISFFLMWIVAFTDKGIEDRWKNYNVIKTSVVVISGAIIALMATALYISFTPVGLNTIYGCQGRYILPLMCPFFSIIGSNRIKNEMSKRVYNGVVILSISVILLLGVWQAVIKFYK